MTGDVFIPPTGVLSLPRAYHREVRRGIRRAFLVPTVQHLRERSIAGSRVARLVWVRGPLRTPRAITGITDEGVRVQGLCVVGRWTPRRTLAARRFTG